MVASEAGFEICSDNEQQQQQQQYDGHQASCFNGNFDKNFQSSMMTAIDSSSSSASSPPPSPTSILRTKNLEPDSESLPEVPESSNSLSSVSSFLDPYHSVNNNQDNNHHYNHQSYPKSYKFLHKRRRQQRRKHIININNDNFNKIDQITDTICDDQQQQQQQNHNKSNNSNDSIQTRDEYYSYDSRSMIEPSFVIRFLCYFSYLILIIFGYFRMFMEWLNLGDYNTIIEHNRKVCFVFFSNRGNDCFYIDNIEPKNNRLIFCCFFFPRSKGLSTII